MNNVNQGQPLLVLKSGDFEPHLWAFLFLSSYNRHSVTQGPNLPYFPAVVWRGEVKVSNESHQECVQLDHADSIVSYIC